MIGDKSTYTPRIPTIAKVNEKRSALKEKPAGTQKIEPHNACVIRGMPVQPVGRQSPCSKRPFTARANDQSSSRGKSPTGFTIRTLTTYTFPPRRGRRSRDFL